MFEEFRYQKVAGSNPVTSTKSRSGFLEGNRFVFIFLSLSLPIFLQKQGVFCIFLHLFLAKTPICQFTDFYRPKGHLRKSVHFLCTGSKFSSKKSVHFVLKISALNFCELCNMHKTSILMQILIYYNFSLFKYQRKR